VRSKSLAEIFGIGRQRATFVPVRARRLAQRSTPVRYADDVKAIAMSWQHGRWEAGRAASIPPPEAAEAGGRLDKYSRVLNATGTCFIIRSWPFAIAPCAVMPEIGSQLGHHSPTPWDSLEPLL
jgi:hypothetical protein